MVTVEKTMAVRSGREKLRMETIKIKIQDIRMQNLHLQEIAEVSQHQDHRKRNPSVMYTNGNSQK